MKKIILFISLLWGILYAQAPQFINFQGIVKDNNGKCLQNQTIDLKLIIYDGDPANNMVVYEETHNTTTDDQGLFAVRIGAGTVTTPGSYVFSDIDWSNSKSVRTEVNNTFLGIVPLQTVPFAFFTELSDSSRKAVFAYNGKSDFQGNEEIHFTNSNSDTTVSILSTDQDGLGEIKVLGPNKNLNLSLGGLSSTDPNNGYLQVNDINGFPKAELKIKSLDRGQLILNNSLSPPMIVADISSDVNGNGFAEIKGNNQGEFQFGFLDATGYRPQFGLSSQTATNSNLFNRVTLEVDGAGNGIINVYDTNGMPKVILSTNGAGNGFLTVNGANNMSGTMNGAVKNFVMPHPNNPEKNIVYACIEGPEAAAYERGTAKLVNGEAFIPFSDHFELVINPETLTILTSPLSGESKGLAIIEKTQNGFKVQELMGAKGNYSFDWEAKAVRKGYEDYQVIRDKNK